MAELVDAPDLGSGIARCGSSSLLTRTIWAFRPVSPSFILLQKNQWVGPSSIKISLIVQLTLQNMCSARELLLKVIEGKCWCSTGFQGGVMSLDSCKFSVTTSLRLRRLMPLT